jgi:hypothetical protein
MTRGPGPQSGRSSRRALLAGLAALALGIRPAGAQSVPAPPARPRPGGPPGTPAPGPAAPAPRTAPAPGPSKPGLPAPPAIVEEIRAAIARAVERFEARDAEGVLQQVSDAYWTGPFSKRTLRAQLVTLLQLHQQVRARVRLDEVRLVGEQAWVWTSGDVTGQLAVVGTGVQLFVWDRELEVARREQGAWRLYGYQQ